VSVKSFRSFVRRLSIVAVSTAVGSAAVIALSATPAYAHDVRISGEQTCVNGNWVVAWTVKHDQTAKVGTLTAVTHTPSTTLTTIVVGAQVPFSPGTLTETVTLPGSTASASLSVTMTWPRRSGDDSFTTTLTLGGDCVPPAPQISVDDDSDCDSLTIKVTNTGTVQASGTVTPNGGAAQPFNLAPGADQTFTFPGGAGVSATVALGNRSDTFEWKDPGDCPTATTPPPATTTTTPPLPVTGASLTSLIGVGGALVLVGGVLLMVLRRRRRLGES
jgi:LPXTG-motif cell wall-anchored protein